jgi:hypothetical protein
MLRILDQGFCKVSCAAFRRQKRKRVFLGNLGPLQGTQRPRTLALPFYSQLCNNPVSKEREMPFMGIQVKHRKESSERAFFPH